MIFTTSPTSGCIIFLERVSGHFPFSILFLCCFFFWQIASQNAIVEHFAASIWNALRFVIWYTLWIDGGEMVSLLSRLFNCVAVSNLRQSGWVHFEQKLWFITFTFTQHRLQLMKYTFRHCKCCSQYHFSSRMVAAIVNVFIFCAVCPLLFARIIISSISALKTVSFFSSIERNSIHKLIDFICRVWKVIMCSFNRLDFQLKTYVNCQKLRSCNQLNTAQSLCHRCMVNVQIELSKAHSANLRLSCRTVFVCALSQHQRCFDACCGFGWIVKFFLVYFF